MKVIVASILLVFTFGTDVYATAVLPPQNVWVTPVDAVAQAPITLNALVYNSSASTALMTVEFSVDGASIGSVVLTIPKETAKTAQIAWTQPSAQTSITVAVIKAVSSAGKPVPALVGTVGEVTVTTALAMNAQKMQYPWSGKVSGVLSSAVAFLEPFRTAQAKKYATLRDTVKARIGIEVANQVGSQVTKILTPEIPAAPNIPGVATSTATQGARIGTVDNPFDYVTLVYATALASTFGHKAAFYIAVVLIALISIRFIIRKIL